MPKDNLRRVILRIWPTGPYMGAGRHPQTRAKALGIRLTLSTLLGVLLALEKQKK